MATDRADVARVLAEIAELLEASDEGPHRVRAFRTAARTVARFRGDLAAAARDGSLRELRGVGEVTARVVRELVETGDSPYRQGLIERLPDAGVTGVPPARWPLLDAARPAGELLAGLQASPLVERAEIAGELRRALETIGTIDVVVQLDPSALGAGADPLRTLPGFGSAITQGNDMVSVRLPGGLVARLWSARRESFGTAWIRATGSDDHVRALHERSSVPGELPACADESDVYGALGLPFVAPELREWHELVELVASNGIPPLLALEDVRGCVHCHTHFSDGKASVEEMANAARRKGWRYLGLADHSAGAHYARGMDEDSLARQLDEIAAWNDAHGRTLLLLAGVEADIRVDGSLDLDAYRPDLLERLDFVVGSVHSRFKMEGPAMTERILRALDDPRVSVLGHPTGKRPLEREPYAVDLDAVFERAAERGVAIELNGHPRRLDLDWRYLPAALARGVTISIGPDAHSVDALDNVELGVMMARKGLLRTDDVLNTRPPRGVLEFFRGQNR